MRKASSTLCLALWVSSATCHADAVLLQLRPDPLFRSGYEFSDCGNGVVEDAEQCDGANVDGEDCITLGLLGGNLACTLGCRFDTAQCISNNAPIAVNDQVLTNEDTMIAIPVATLLANDVDPDADPLSITVVANAMNGAVMLTPGIVNFTPAANFNGSASFEYTLSDGDLTDTGLVTVLVLAVNDPPAAQAQSIAVSQNSGSNIVTLSAADIDSVSVSFEIITSPANGSLGAISAIGNFAAEVAYTPNVAYVGADSFSFRVFDGGLHSGAALVTIDVSPAATADAPAQ
jgi:hypothetical protein